MAAINVNKSSKLVIDYQFFGKHILVHIIVWLLVIKLLIISEQICVFYCVYLF